MKTVLYLVIVGVPMILAITQLFAYAVRQKPVGPDAGALLQDVFCNVLTLVFIFSSLVCWYYIGIGVASFVLLVPSMLLIVTNIEGLTSLTTGWIHPAKPVTITIDNRKSCTLHVRINAVIRVRKDHTEYYSLDYYQTANTERSYFLSEQESSLITRQCIWVEFIVYNEANRSANGSAEQILHRIEQPSMFADGAYRLSIEE